MEILVIGGTYFLGKRFVELAVDEHNITILNRGTRKLDLDNRINSITADRHDTSALMKLKEKNYDVVVDFCAYVKDDISAIFENLPNIKQYIFISTCDVYRRGLDYRLDENAPLEDRSFGGEAGDYIAGKVALEEELVECAARYNVQYTSIRPAFIYGPDNYAPREGIYFYWINNAGQIIQPVDATGEFQMVYVEDVARAILKCLGNSDAYNTSYNIAPNKMVTYEGFTEALKEAIDIPFEIVGIDINTINEKSIPLPFPLTREESNWYDGDKALELIDSYTRLSEGLRKTFYNEK